MRKIWSGDETTLLYTHALPIDTYTLPTHTHILLTLTLTAHTRALHTHTHSSHSPPPHSHSHPLPPSLILRPVKKVRENKARLLSYSYTLPLPRSLSPVHTPPFTPPFTLPCSLSPVHSPYRLFQNILGFVNWFSQSLQIISCRDGCMLEHVTEKVCIRNVVLKEVGKRKGGRKSGRERKEERGRGRESR